MSRRGVMFKPVQGRDCAIASPRQSKTDWWRVRAQVGESRWELFILLAVWRARRVSGIPLCQTLPRGNGYGLE